MGRTLPSATQNFLLEEESFSRFRRALRRSDQLALDELFATARQHLAAAAYAAHALPMEVFLLAMLLEPVQSAINAGGREGLDWGLQWPHVACGCPPDYMLDQIWSVHSHVLCRMAVFFLTQPWSGTWVLSS